MNEHYHFTSDPQKPRTHALGEVRASSEAPAEQDCSFSSLSRTSDIAGSFLGGSALRRCTLFLDPRRHAAVEVHHIRFSAVRAEVEIVVRKGSVDFVEQRLGDKEGPAFPARFHLYRADLLFGKDAKKVPRTDLVPELSCVFRARVHARSAADALVVGVIENPQRAFIL